jgi:ParB family chromosome partitioning protein
MDKLAPISEIVIGERHRRDMGDIACLAASIEAIGLLHPVVVNTELELIAGARRIAAYGLLGRDAIPVRQVSIDSIVLGEMAKNELRKDFTVSERVAIGKAVEERTKERRGRDNPQNLAELRGKETRTIAAEKSGFGNAETYRQAKTIVDSGAQELIAAVDEGDISIAAGASIAKLPRSQQVAIIKAGPARAAKAEPHRAIGTGFNEWHTPQDVIDAARDVLVTIDLDPASTEAAQRTVRAARYFTKEDDGLTQEWRGKVWLNPPYAQPEIANFVEKLIDEYVAGRVSQAILLTHNFSDTQWFHAAARAARVFCLTKGRVRFVDTDGNLASPTNGQCFFYFGDRPHAFDARFCEIGFVVGPYRPADNMTRPGGSQTPEDAPGQVAT